MGTSLSQRALKSQQVTLLPVLTAELGPASPNRRRSCNHTLYGQGDTSRMKPPSATHAGDSRSHPTGSTFWSGFCSQSLLGVGTNAWFGQGNTERKPKEEATRTAILKPATQVPSPLLAVSFSSYTHTKKRQNLLEIIRGKEKESQKLHLC